MDANQNAEELLRLVNGDAWHGPSLRELLSGLTAEQASTHPLNGRHSIWEIVNHVTVWHNAVTRRIDGEITEPEGEEDWPPVTDDDENSWKVTCQMLYSSAEKVAEAMRSVTNEKMNETVPGKSYPFHVMLSGLPSHDASHSGQISLLRKVMEESVV